FGTVWQCLHQRFNRNAAVDDGSSEVFLVEIDTGLRRVLHAPNRNDGDRVQDVRCSAGLNLGGNRILNGIPGSGAGFHLIFGQIARCSTIPGMNWQDVAFWLDQHECLHKWMAPGLSAPQVVQSYALYKGTNVLKMCLRLGLECVQGLAG